MEQIRYIAFAFLLLIAGVIAYSIVKPFATSVLIADQEEKQPGCGTANLYPATKAIVNMEGKTLFSNNCQICHAIHKVITGPALSDVESRGPWTDRNDLVRWIQNPRKFNTKDAYTKGLIAQYGQLMTAFPQLTKEQIFSILDYIKEASGPVPVALNVK